MTTKVKWILTGVIVLVLVIGLVLGAGAQRWFWGYGPGYMAGWMSGAPSGPGMMGQQGYGPGYGYGSMMGQDQFGRYQGSGPGMMGRDGFGPGMMGRGGSGPGMMGRGNFGPGMMGRGGSGPGMMGRGGFGPGGMMGFGPGEDGSANSLLTVAAEKLGLTTDDLATQLQAGKTIADLAKEKDVALNTIVDAVVSPRAERLAEAVKNGDLTQEQADAMQALMKANMTARLNEKWSAGGPGGAFCPGDTDKDGVCERGGFGPMGRWQ